MRKFVVSAGLVLLILGLGGGAFAGLSSLRKKPAEKQIELVPAAVETVRVVAADHTVEIAGYGNLRARDHVALSPEVSGLVLAVSERLETGMTVEAGELLVRIDPRPFRNAVDQITAEMQRLTASRSRLDVSEKGDRERLTLLKRTHALSKAEFERAKGLLEDGEIGTVSQVEALERAVLSAETQIVALENGLALYAIQRDEIAAQIASARASLATAKLNLEKTEIRAPFTGRVEAASVEKGQVISPGREILRLVDDRVLELPLTLDGRDLALWLPFEPASDGRWWFGKPAAGETTVCWVEQPGHPFSGTFDRIERYDPQTRTAVAVITLKKAASRPGPPLVEGMFCRARVRGKILHGVFRVPRSAVADDGTAYFDDGGKLARRTLDVVRTEGDVVFVSGGLSDGDELILTRLLQPVAGMPVRQAAPPAQEK